MLNWTTIWYVDDEERTDVHPSIHRHNHNICRPRGGPGIPIHSIQIWILSTAWSVCKEETDRDGDRERETWRGPLLWTLVVIYANVRSHFHPFNYHVEINILGNFNGHIHRSWAQLTQNTTIIRRACLTGWMDGLMCRVDRRPSTKFYAGIWDVVSNIAGIGSWKLGLGNGIGRNGKVKWYHGWTSVCPYPFLWYPCPHQTIDNTTILTVAQII